MKPVDVVKKNEAIEAGKSTRLKDCCSHIEEYYMDGIFVYDCTETGIGIDEEICTEPCTVVNWKTCPLNKSRK